MVPGLRKWVCGAAFLVGLGILLTSVFGSRRPVEYVSWVATPQPTTPSDPPPTFAPRRVQLVIGGKQHVLDPATFSGVSRVANETCTEQGKVLRTLYYEVPWAGGKVQRVEVENDADLSDAPNGKVEVLCISSEPSRDEQQRRVYGVPGGRVPRECPSKPRRYHTVVTTTSKIYEQWLTRVSYYWFRKMKERDTCGEMGGYTRLLHSPPDELMDEIPTVSVPRLGDHRECNQTGVNDCDLGFVVLNRPHAMRELFRRLAAKEVAIPEDYILLCEPDHFFLKPIPNLAASLGVPVTFDFNYMRIAEKDEPIMAPYLPHGFAPSSLIPGGPSPALMTKEDWAVVIEPWWNISFSLRRQGRAVDAFGWVLEMWGFVGAIAQTENPMVALKDFQIEPCAVRRWKCAKHLHPLGEKYESLWKGHRGVGPWIAHVTQAHDFELTGQEGLPDSAPQHEKENPPWALNKRHYSGSYPPPNLTSTPPGCEHENAEMVLEMINEAAAHYGDKWGKFADGKLMPFGRDTCRDAGRCDNFPRRHILERLGISKGVSHWG
eukprot:Sspe_Gene.21207::Locus_7909_Transcript_1_1_Confidence_1.000_Length_1794::g.21207::m.21207/K20782/HPAT; hydroxyproline O-arabinosyltransferase